MSYVQIEIGGKLRGLKFNQLAIELMAEYNDNQTATSVLYSMVYAGLRGNDYVKRVDPEYSFEDVCDWVDGMDDKQQKLDKIAAALNESQIWKSLVSDGVEKYQEGPGKKKMQKSGRMKT